MTKKALIKESDIQKAILQFLKAKNILHWRVNLGAVMHNINGKMIFRKNPMRGFPDIAGVVEGRMFAIEVKSLNGKMSEPQIEWKDKLESNGVKYIIATSVEDIEKEVC